MKNTHKNQQGIVISSTSLLHVMMIILRKHIPFPEPMWFPHTLSHVINGDSFSLWYEEHCKQSHHYDPSTEEEEYS